MVDESPIVTGVLSLHREGELLRASFRSLLASLRRLSVDGIHWEMLCVLDKTDSCTRSVVAEEIEQSRDSRSCIRVVEVQVGDLGLSRNESVKESRGAFIGFLDGDDLCGTEWFLRAYRRCSTEPRIIAHPELNVYFGRYSGIFAHLNQCECDLRTLFFNNLWTALSFASKQIYSAVPYSRNEITNGIGYEDWHFNCRAIEAGYNHVAVRETCHFIRLKGAAAGLCDQSAQNYCVIKPVLFWSTLRIGPPQQSDIDRQSDAFKLVGHDPASISRSRLPTWLESEIDRQNPSLDLKDTLLNISPKRQNASVLECLDSRILDRIIGGIDTIHFVASSASAGSLEQREMIVADQVPTSGVSERLICLGKLEEHLHDRLAVFIGTLIVQSGCRKIHLWDSVKAPIVIKKISVLLRHLEVEVVWHQLLPGSSGAEDLLPSECRLPDGWRYHTHVGGDKVFNPFGLGRFQEGRTLRVLFLVNSSTRAAAWSAQSTMYRVVGPGEALRGKGHDVFYGLLSEYDRWKFLIQDKLCDIVILHRGHACREFDLLRQVTRQSGVPLIFEFDDNIISPKDLPGAAHLQGLSPNQIDEIMGWAQGNIRCLKESDAVIVATEELLEKSQLHRDASFLFPNYIPNFFRAPLGFPCAFPRNNDAFSMFYGPGTLEHSVHLREVSAGVAEVLDKISSARFVLGGGLPMPDILRCFADRVICLPRMAPQYYLQCIQSMDLVLAPLAKDSFSVCKSWIKVLEAAAMGVDWVASALPSYERFGVLTGTGSVVRKGDSWANAILTSHEQISRGHRRVLSDDWSPWMDDRADEYAKLLSHIIEGCRPARQRVGELPEEVAPRKSGIGHCQLYWAGEGEDFREPRSLKFELLAEELSVFEFEIPFSGVSRLRLDPLDCKARIEILELSVVGLATGAPLFNIDDRRALRALQILGRHRRIRRLRSLVFVARDNDPQILLPDIGPLHEGVRIKVFMKVSINEGELADVSRWSRTVRRFKSAAGYRRMLPCD